MKLKNRYVIATLIIVLVSSSIGFAKESTTIRVVQKGKLVSIANTLTKGDGDAVLVIDENEALRTFTEEGVRLVSSNQNAVAVLNGTILVGVSADTEAVITAVKGDQTLTFDGLDSLTVRVREPGSERHVVTEATFLPFKTVKDNFGKKFAQSYFVVQVDIRNEKEDQQFIVQTVDVMLDPNQCDSSIQIYHGFKPSVCRDIFDKFFKFPRAQQGVRSQEVLAAGKADLNRSNRNVGFRILSFSAAMGTILTGFNGVLGPDGVKGMTVLGTTVAAAASGLFPNSADEKLENLRSSLPTEDVIIKSKESKTFNIFIPTERVLWQDSWNEYIKPARDSGGATYEFRAVLEVVLLSSATGVLVDNDAPPVTAKSGDRADAQVERFQLNEVPPEFFATATEANAALAVLRDDLLSSDLTKEPGSGLTKKQNAEAVLRAILASLRADSSLKTFTDKESSITAESDGESIRKALLRMRRAALRAGNDELVNKINEKIVKQANKPEENK